MRIPALIHRHRRALLLTVGAFLVMVAVVVVLDPASARVFKVSQLCPEGNCSGGGGGGSTVDPPPPPPPPDYLLSVTKLGNGTVTSDPSGINCGASCSALYVSGTTVALTATPDPGWIFSAWTNSCSGSGGCSVLMNTNRAVGARFVQPTFSLSVTNSGGGTVTSAPTGINCGATCSANFTQGTTVTLIATLDANYVFTGWGGACTGTGSCSVIMDSAKSVTATFALQNRNLTVTNGGGGTVNSSPAGINCGATCTATYPAGTTVTLSEIPNYGYRFVGWSGGCLDSGACVIILTADTTVGASFSPVLIVNRSGSGSVQSSPVGINCGATCTAAFASGTVVTLTATPAFGYQFAGWSGDCVGLGTCTVTMNGLRNVTANFSTSVAVQVSVSNSGGGIVTSSPSGINCGLTCIANFPIGETITLSPVSAYGYTFTGWSGDCSGTNDCSLFTDGPKSANATFTLLPTYSLSVSSGVGGTVTSNPAGIDCGATCTAMFPQATSVTLTAAVSIGYRFDGWAGDCTGTGSCVLVMTGPHSVSATFTPVSYTLTVVNAGGGSVNSQGNAAIRCGATCAASFPRGTVVQLGRSRNLGRQFVGWGGACSGSGLTCSVTMDADKTVSADFSTVIPLRTLTVSKAGTGQGYIDALEIDYEGLGWPLGTCDPSCPTQAVSIEDGSTARVQAWPTAQSPQSYLAGWSGACTGGALWHGDLCIFAVTADASLTATFTSTTYTTLTLAVTPSGSGTITSDDTGFFCFNDCGTCTTNCTAKYAPVATVVLTATPAVGQQFTGWSGACTGTQSTCTVNMSSSRSVTATFSPPPSFTLTVSRIGTGSGRVTSVPAGIDCGATCTTSYLQGTPVTLTASADPGMLFEGWSGACTGTGTCSVTLTADATVSARFTDPCAVGSPRTICPDFNWFVDTGDTLPQSWGASPNAPTIIPYGIDFASIPANLSANDFISSVQASLDRWVAASGNRIIFEYLGDCSGCAAHTTPDAVNVFGFRSLGIGGGGITETYVDSSGPAIDGFGKTYRKVIESDIILDSTLADDYAAVGLPCTAEGCIWKRVAEGIIDFSTHLNLEDFLTHEIGHVLGLDEMAGSGYSLLSMFQYPDINTANASAYRMSLASGETNGATCIYGQAASAACHAGLNQP